MLYERIKRLGWVITKILEIFHWVGAALMAAAKVCALAAPDWVGGFVGIDAKECCGAELNVYGFEVTAPAVNGAMGMTALFLFGIGAVVILVLMAMVFRNLHLIFRYSENDTPFRADKIRRMKGIGIFSIAVLVVGVLMCCIVRLVLGVDAVETGVNQGGIFMGIIVLCLTQFFVRGAQLEEDVDGLL